MTEREKVYFDIHGVNDVVDETAEEGFVDRKLDDMAHALAKLKTPEKAAFDLARSTNSAYVDDPNFRLRFLRAERFDPKRAAIRYAKHYDLKLQLFGVEKLGRPIVQDDLGEEALEALYSGKAQVLRQRDSAGRAICLWIASQHAFSANQKPYSKETLVCYGC